MRTETLWRSARWRGGDIRQLTLETVHCDWPELSHDVWQIACFLRGNVVSYDRPRERRGARQELLSRARARSHRDQAAEYLKLARSSGEANVRNRYLTIVRHYRTLAEAEERSAAEHVTERSCGGTELIGKDDCGGAPPLL